MSITKEDIDKLREELNSLKPDEPAPQNIIESMNYLHDTLEKFVTLLENANREIMEEYGKGMHDTAAKMDTLIQQNEKIARGVIALADLMKKNDLKPAPVATTITPATPSIQPQPLLTPGVQQTTFTFGEASSEPELALPIMPRPPTIAQSVLPPLPEEARVIVPPVSKPTLLAPVTPIMPPPLPTAIPLPPLPAFSPVPGLNDLQPRPVALPPPPLPAFSPVPGLNDLQPRPATPEPKRKSLLEKFSFK